MDVHPSGRSGTLPADAIAADDADGVTRRRFLTAAGVSFIAATLAACGGGGGADATTGPGGGAGGSMAGGGTGGTSGGLPTGVTIAGTSVIINLITQSGLATAGGFLVVNSGSTNAMVVNLGGNSFRAFTSVCTHQGCTTDWVFTGVRFKCNCHGSQFDTNGNVVVGPAASPLMTFPVAFNASTSTLTITTG